MNKQTEVFKTDDTPLAAFLITEGYSLIDIIFNGRFANYLFSNDDPDMQALVKDFQLLRAKTNAAQIIFNYQELIKRAKRGV